LSKKKQIKLKGKELKERLLLKWLKLMS